MLKQSDTSAQTTIESIADFNVNTVLWDKKNQTLTELLKESNTKGFEPARLSNS